jgi:hypothetical protein
MANAPATEKTLGYFTEKTYGKVFDYSAADEMILSPPAHGGRNVVFPHKIYVGPNNETRWALVKGNVAHVIVDERDDGSWIVEKWDIVNHRKF